MCPNFLIKRVSIRIVCKQKHFKLSILGEPPKSKAVFWGGSFPKSVYPPTPGFF